VGGSSKAADEQLALLEAGSNSLKLYLVRPHEGEQSIEVFKFPWSVAHEFFSAGSLSEATIDEIVARIREARETAPEADFSRALAIATGVFREIDGLDQLLERIARDTSVRVRLITGTDEARLMARGFRELAKEQPAILCDLGGATMEWAAFAESDEPACGSLRLGAIRNEYRLAGLKPSPDEYMAASDAFCDRELDQLPVSGAVKVVVTGGTAEALALVVGSDTISREQLCDVIERVQRDGPPEQLKPSRKRVFLPGLAILLRLLKRCGASELRYGTAAVRYGMVRRLLALLDKVPRTQLHATQLLRTIDGRHLLTGDPVPEVELESGARVGRYQVVERIGVGAMSMVYRATDPELGRDVALKVMRARGVAGDRLLREAQALAKLSHPNVVAVHDVGRVDDDVFIAMELVEGMTLSAWLRRRERSVEDVVAVFVAAGRGLAAAHAAGLIQRDFKPDNTIVGDDGRVRVLDFGLARAASDDAAQDATGRYAGAPDRSASGVVGTPAYMAPEQFTGGEVDERTDQFSYCVAFWAALYDAPPFAGETVEEIEATVTGGRISPPPADVDVPVWLHETVRRGLEVDPDDRHISMAALLERLERDPGAKLRKAVLAFGAVAAVAIAAVSYWYGQHNDSPAREPQVCAGAERRLEGVWDPTVKSSVRRAFLGTRLPHANTTYDRVTKVLDGYAAAWAVMMTDACEATRVFHRQSDRVFELRTTCLEQRLSELRELAVSFADEPSQSVVDNAVRRAFELAPIEGCADVEALASGAVRPPVAGGGGCGVPAADRYYPIEIGRAWVYDVIDPATRLPRSQDPKVVTVEALERMGGCKGDTMAYRMRRDAGPGYAHRWIEVQSADSPGEYRAGQVAVRHRDTWFTDDGVATKDEYYEPSRVRLDETCERTLARASFLDSYDEVEAEVGAVGHERCGKAIDRKNKTFDWQVVATGVPVRLRMSFSHPACCAAGEAGACRPPPDGPGHSCKRTEGGGETDWTCDFETLQVRRSEVRGGKHATYWFAAGVGKVKEVSKGDEIESLICFAIP
jgi:hypothetical protein